MKNRESRKENAALRIWSYLVIAFTFEGNV